MDEVVVSPVGEHIPKKAFLNFPADNLPEYRETLERLKEAWKK